ncbi:hypothetical protein PENTCL1PPCAC_3918, partial [Pristionchus entomophagus]
VTRTHLLFANVILHLCCTCFEMKIAIERIFSSCKPLIYQDSGFSWRWNIPCIAPPVSVFVVVRYEKIFSGTLLALLFPSIVDLSTVLLNWIGMRHLGMRFDSLFQTNATLNARYQVQPSIFYRECTNFVWANIENAQIHYFNCGFSSIFLIVHCDFIKNSICSMVGRDR